MSQTSYSLDSVAAIPGQLYDANLPGNDIVSYVAQEDIPAGRMLNLRTDGRVELTKSASLGVVAGFSIYKPFQKATAIGAPGFTYKAGEVVPVMRKGRVYVELTGAAPTAGVALNVNSNATAAADLGKMTITAAGANIFATAAVCFSPGSVSGLAVAELNIP